MTIETSEDCFGALKRHRNISLESYESGRQSVKHKMFYYSKIEHMIYLPPLRPSIAKSKKLYKIKYFQEKAAENLDGLALATGKSFACLLVLYKNEQ